MSSEFEKFQRLVQKIAPHTRLLRTWPLTGGISAQVTAMELERLDGQTEKMIIRRHGDADFQNNSNVAADEFKLLHILKRAGVAVPAPLYVDKSGEIFDRPVIVIEFVEGKSELAPAKLDNYLLQVATHLARIHHVDSAKLGFLPLHTVQPLPEKLDNSLDEQRIREMLQSTPQRNPSGLLHGDFWPGNILWKDNQLAAVIDWEDAAIGDPLVDVANARLEILWAFDAEAMEHFTEQYQVTNMIDFSGLPYWDLHVALRNLARIGGWGLDEGREKSMRERLKWFIQRAMKR